MKKSSKRPETINQVRVARLWRRMRFDVEATVVMPLRPDGIPQGLGTGKTSLIPRRALDAPKAQFMVTSMWILTAFFSLYAAQDVRAFVQHDENLSDERVLVATVESLQTVSNALGVTSLRGGVEGLFSAIKSKTDDEAWLARAGVENAPGISGTLEEEPSNEPSLTPQTSTTRVLLIGASSMEFYLGAELERRLENYRGINVHRFGKLGTGLARPDEFDWPKQITQLLRHFKPHLVVAQFGGNDGQPMTNSAGTSLPFGTPAWEKEYVARLQKVVGLVQKSDARLVMLGMPITRHKKHSEKLEIINSITKKTTEDLGETYIPTWDIAVDERGKARDNVQYLGKSGPMYLADGVHFARVGAAMVANRLAYRLERLLELVPQDSQLAAVWPLEMKSKVRDTQVRYLAFVPQSLVPNEKVPALLLLHGADASSLDFSENAHVLLQQLSEKFRLILIAPDADGQGWYLDSPRVKSSQIETFLMNEFLPNIRQQLPISDRMGIAGISMGGNGALVLAMKHSGVFLSASALSGAVDLSQAATRLALVDRLGAYEENSELWEQHSAVHRVRSQQYGEKPPQFFFTVGKEDKWLLANQALHDAFTEENVPHEYQEYEGDHSWTHWVNVLPTHIAWHAHLLRPDLKTLPVFPEAKN